MLTEDMTRLCAEILAMRKMRGKADPSLARTILDELLNR